MCLLLAASYIRHEETHTTGSTLRLSLMHLQPLAGCRRPAPVTTSPRAADAHLLMLGVMGIG